VGGSYISRNTRDARTGEPWLIQDSLTVARAAKPLRPRKPDRVHTIN
jgi:hypothetical protein